MTPFSPFILIQTLALVPAKALSFVPVLTSYSEVRRIQIILTNAISKLLLSCLFKALPLAQSNSFKVHAVVYYFFRGRGWGGGGGEEVARKGTPYNGLYGESPPEMGTCYQLQVTERVGISLVEVYERVGNLSFRSLV